MADDQLLTVDEAMAHLGIRNRTKFFKLVRDFDVPRYKKLLEGKRIFFKPEDLDQLKQPVRIAPHKKAA